MHARVTSVSFPCVDLSCLGSPEPQKIKSKRTKVHAFIFVPDFEKYPIIKIYRNR